MHDDVDESVGAQKLFRIIGHMRSTENDQSIGIELL